MTDGQLVSEDDAELPEDSPLQDDIPVKSDPPMKILSLQDIADAEDITEEVVPVPQWGGAVKIRSITQRQMDQMRQESKGEAEDSVNETTLQQRIIMHAMIEPNVTSLAEVEIIWGKSSAAVMTILTAIIKNSGLNMKVAVKEAEKSFPAGQR